MSDTAPGHTDLMVSPEDIDAYLEANPPPMPRWCCQRCGYMADECACEEGYLEAPES
jgi:hypothetical protein